MKGEVILKTNRRWVLFLAAVLTVLGIGIMSQSASAATKASKATYPTLSSANYPKTVKMGTPFSVRGIVRSNTTITALRAGVYRDKKGRNAVTARSIRPYATVYSIDRLDPYIYFDRLAPGSYYYVIAAQNSAGSKILLSKAFKVTGGSATTTYPRITGANYPKTVRRGGVFSVKGTVRSTVKMTNVTAGVFLNSNATGLRTGRSVNPNSTTFSLARIDQDIHFESLARGTYYYIVKATNAYGTKILVRKAFNVI